MVAVVVLSVAVYAAFTRRYFLPNTLQPLRGHIGTLNKFRLDAMAWHAFGGLALHVAYIVGALMIWRAAPSRRLVALVWGGAVVAGLVLVAIFPVTSTDIFDYLFRGRMAAAYGANPYIAVPNLFKQDPLFATVGWPNAPSAYGPLWEILSRSMAALGGATLLPNVWLHKALAFATYLACGGVIWWLTAPQGRRVQLVASFVWLWSPLTLWEIVAAGHNDGLLILSVLLAVWAAERRRILTAVVILTVGTLLKFLPILLLPLVVVYGMRQHPTWRARLYLGTASVAIFVVLTVAAYAPYWEGPATLRNIAVRENFVTAAPWAAVSYGLRQAGPLDAINDLLVRFNLPHPANREDIIKGVSRVASTFLGIGILWQLWQIVRHRRSFYLATWSLLLWYLVLGSQWFQPWYVLWLLALLALHPERRAWGWLTAWALAGQTSYLLQFFVQPLLQRSDKALTGQHPLIQLAYCGLIFGPPLLVWSITAWNGRSRSDVEAHPTPQPA